MIMGELLSNVKKSFKLSFEGIYQKITRHTVLVINIGILVFCIVAVHRLYSGRIAAGIGDDWSLFTSNHFSSLWEFISRPYLTRSGRVGAYLLDYIFTMPNHIKGLSPEKFPWWLIYAVSLFCTIFAPINLVFIVKKVARISRFENLFLLIIVFCLGVINVVVYKVTLMAVTVNVSLAIFLLVIMLNSTLSQATILKRRCGFLLLLSLTYVVCSLTSELLMITLPIIFFGFTIAMVINRKRSGKELLKEGIYWIALSGLSAVIYFAAPGQKIKASAVHASFSLSVIIYRLGSWYQSSIVKGYAALFGANVPYAIALHTILMILLLVLLVFFTFVSIRMIRQDISIPEIWNNSLILCYMALLFMIAFLASTSTLIVSHYFPWYGFKYPIYLLVFGIALSVILFFRIAINISIFRQIVVGEVRNDAFKGRPIAVGSNVAAKMIAVASIALIVGEIMPSNVEKIMALYREAVYRTSIKLNAYNSVIDDHNKTGQEFYLLSKGPPSMDSPWGTDAYFSRKGYPEIKIAFEGEANALPFLEDEKWKKLPCKIPPAVISSDLNNSKLSSDPIRKMLYINKVGKGCYDFDFWVGKEIEKVVLKGRYNPNIAASPTYYRTYTYNIEFLDDKVSRKRKLIIDQIEDGGNVSLKANVSIHFFYMDQLVEEVPLDAFLSDNTKPLVRVTVEGVYPGWITNYTVMKMERS
jgi:hypothetical protein